MASSFTASDVRQSSLGDIAMPMTKAFEGRLHPDLKGIAEQFGTPFHIYDEVGIRETCRLFRELSQEGWFRQFFAVKALPNPHVLRILHQEGMGFDCASIPEIRLATYAGAVGEDIFFTSYNTVGEEFQEAMRAGAKLNLDDTCFLELLDPFPELACFRMAAAGVGKECRFIGSGQESKFGIPSDRLPNALCRALGRGATRFGLHAMLCSNERSADCALTIAESILSRASSVALEVGITLEFVNIGGGIGIPYRPGETVFDFAKFSDGLARLRSRHFDCGTAIYMECGRYVTGPHGALVTSVTNVMQKFRTIVGVDAGMSALMRPAMYPDAYHHVSFPFSNGRAIAADVVGSLCENNDKFARGREIRCPERGDLALIHDTGAHSAAMGFNYNGRLRPKELLLRASGDVVLIRSAETIQDYFSTIVDADLLMNSQSQE